MNKPPGGIFFIKIKKGASPGTCLFLSDPEQPHGIAISDCLPVGR